MKLQIKTSDKTGESLYYGTHKSGLSIYIMPRKDYTSTYAIFGTKYGSVDSDFVVPGEEDITHVPDGIAHFLEHKMFEQEDGSNVFESFAKTGAMCNAYTSFNLTGYLFKSSSNPYAALKVLLDYVQKPYFTKENVDKEQGIIGQEINMGDDDPSWKLLFNFLKAMYHNNPVRLEIAGSVESIAEIDAEVLYKCYNTFYNLSNMSLVLVGDVDPDRAMEVVNKGIIKDEPFGEEIKRVYPEEPKSICKKKIVDKMNVSIPLFMLGFKDNDIGYGGERLLRKDIEIEILTEMIFGKSSPLYEKLYNEGLINQKFSAEYEPQIDYGFTAADGESKDPEKVFDEVISYIDNLHKKGLSEEEFERIKKVIWGRYIRSYNDIGGFAHRFIALNFMDIDYTEYYNVYKNITFEDVKKRFEKHFDKEYAVLSVVEPM